MIIVYDLIYVGSGPIMMLDALDNSINHNKNILIIDKAKELGGAWKNIKLFGENFVENAVHYLLPNQKGYSFLEIEKIMGKNFLRLLENNFK